ncbi:MAG TPA: trigger factor [Aquificaceae bacterium]|nr:trigger factor [Aquificaceae bacterium]
MKVQVQDREGLFKSLTVEVQGNNVKEKLEETYREIQQNVQIQGFRRGKAPLWIIKAKYKDYVEEEVGKKVADETLKQALEEAKLKPVADIFLEKVQVEERESKVTYTVSFEVAPEFELKNVEGLKVEVPKIEFKEELVKEELERLRETNAVWEPKEEDEPAEEGDLLVLEYEVEEVGEEREKVKQETSVILGQGILRQEVEEALKGRKGGEEVELKELSLYNQEGKEIGKVNIKIKIKEIKKKILPELTDEFAQELGYDNLKALEEKIREDLKQRIEKLRNQVIEDRVADKLVELHDMEIPQTLLRREVSFLIERRQNELKAFGIDPRYVDVKKLTEEVKPIAESNIKLRFILDKYAQENGIEPTEDDIEDQYKELAEQYQTTVEEIKKYFKEQGLEPVVSEDARRKKALRDIIAKVEVVEEEVKNESKGNS